MTDTQLESRAGSNVGASPIANLVFLSKAHSKDVVCPLGVETTLWELPVGSKSLRTPMGPGYTISTLIANGNSFPIDLTFRFHDDEGNSLVLGVDNVDPEVEKVSLLDIIEESCWALVGGEKITLTCTDAST